jgi:hypothetical protein
MEGLSRCSAPVLTIKTPGKCKRINGHLDEGGNKNKVAGNKDKGNTIWMY